VTEENGKKYQALNQLRTLIRGPINSMSVVQQVGAQKGLLTRDAIEELLKNAPHDYVLEKVA
jgi:type II secretory pathway predicted ATPase ExeA